MLPSPIEQAVSSLLQRIPEIWEEFDPDKLSVVQNDALRQLVAAGLVERRCRMRFRMLNHALAIEATVTSTGEYGLVEAMESLLASIYQDWEDSFLEWKQDEHGDLSPFHCEQLPPSKWRLTEHGSQALQDLEDGQGRCVTDFVLSHGPLTLRPAVRGSGRLISLEKQDTTSKEGRVNVANWDEGSRAIAETLSELFTKLVADKQTETVRPQQTRQLGRKEKTERQLVDDLKVRAERYAELVSQVLQGSNAARQQFRAEFGATAFATSRAEGDQAELERIKSAVQTTQTYRHRIKPVLNGQPPVDWQSDDDSLVPEILKQMLDRAGDQSCTEC